jgi:hypothetical protein
MNLGSVCRAAGRLWIGCAAFSLAACVTAPPTLYSWGSYEELIYVSQAKPGTLSPEAQADQLEKDRQAADGARKRLPPGWHAHLASLYAQSGHGDLAERELQAEKSEYPEAATLVDRLLANLRGAKP